MTAPPILSPSPALQSLIIGLGRAGRGLHARCIRKIHNGPIGAVDPSVDRWDEHGTRLFSALEEVTGFDPIDTVVHVCTPPDRHLEVTRTAAGLGYRRILVEKPLVANTSELGEMRELIRRHGLDLYVITPWLASRITERVAAAVHANGYGPLRRLSVHQHKPRFLRSLVNGTHADALEVEMPHQVAVALHLAGPARVTAAAVTDMCVADRRLPGMGSATLHLSHESGVATTLESELCAPIRKRMVRCVFDHHEVRGYYPVDGDDPYGIVQVLHPDGTTETEVVEDDPLTFLLDRAYRHFGGSGPPPPGDLMLGAAVTEILSAARVLARAARG
jgi:predicted dehydrogenase